MITRRQFAGGLAATSALITAEGYALGASAKSYGNIMGSNERVNFAVIGLNSRAYAHLSALKANMKDARIATCAMWTRRSCKSSRARGHQHG